MSDPISYLAIGTVTKDKIEGGYTIGGTVSFSGRIAQALGCQTRIVTSATDYFDFDKVWPGIETKKMPALTDTTFSNIYKPEGRTQIVHNVCAPLTKKDIPQAWLDSDIIHLGPLVDEVDPTIIDIIAEDIFIGITPQGWMRTWGDDGIVHPKPWDHAQAMLPKATAVVMSEEDLQHPQMLAEFTELASLLVLTEGHRGCTVFWHDEKRQFPAPKVKAIELTGAGDIFATAFFYEYRRTKGDAWQAAVFANDIAAISLTAETLDSKFNVVVDYLKKMRESEE